MFQLMDMKDKAQVKPESFGKEEDAIQEWINEKYVGKVIPDVGLVIVLFDLLGVGPGRIHPGEGSAYFFVRFRLVVFCGVVGEVLEGKIVKTSPEGVVVSLGFFENVILHSSVLTAPGKTCKFDEEKGEWYWPYEVHKLYLLKGENVRFRVIATRFESLEHFGAQKDEIVVRDGVSSFKKKPKVPLFCIYGTIDEDGLGLVSWWN